VLDNSGWAAVKAATLRMYPDGEAHQQNEYASLLAPDMNFAQLAESAGAHGELLEDPADTEAAIARCLAALRGGRSAVLHARIATLLEVFTMQAPLRIGAQLRDSATGRYFERRSPLS